VRNDLRGIGRTLLALVLVAVLLVGCQPRLARRLNRSAGVRRVPSAATGACLARGLLVQARKEIR
jgi:ABC-type enterobactin transport system permease subunit